MPEPASSAAHILYCFKFTIEGVESRKYLGRHMSSKKQESS
jgi:hypothetical protein